MKKILILPIIAILIIGLSYNNAFASSIPSPPTGLKATTVSTSEIDLSWNTPTSDGGSPITGYSVIRSTDGGLTWHTVTPNTGKTITTFANTGLTPGSAYFYSVHAINGIGTSYASNIVSATTFTQPTGIVTHCGGLASCSYTLTSTAGTGWATTSAGVGGYVGQSPLLFSGISSFLLPGEATANYNAAYSGQAVLAGSSTTAGTLYHVTGTITGLDANDGTIVTGKTDTTIGIKGHSGRGGGIYFTLVSGSISFTKSTTRISSTSVACAPSSITQGGTSTCTVTVTDPGAGVKITPKGTVSFRMSSSIGSIIPASCTLSSGSCSVVFQSNSEYDPSTTSIYATYGGDSRHIGSSGSTLLYITACSTC